MKAFLVLFVIFCTTVEYIKCEATIEELKKSIDACLEEFNIKEDDLKSSEVDDSCIISCINIKVGVIKDKKFNLEKNAEFVRLIEEDEDNAKKMIEAYKNCASKMPEFEDECEFSIELENCVDEEIGIDSSESEEE